MIFNWTPDDIYSYILIAMPVNLDKVTYSLEITKISNVYNQCTVKPVKSFFFPQSSDVSCSTFCNFIRPNHPTCPTSSSQIEFFLLPPIYLMISLPFFCCVRYDELYVVKKMRNRKVQVLPDVLCWRTWLHVLDRWFVSGSNTTCFQLILEHCITVCVKP